VRPADLSHVAGSLVRTTNTAASLRSLIRDFERGEVTRRRLIHELLEGDPEGFCQAAIEYLKTPDESRASQYLVSLLVAQGLLLPVLCDPSLSDSQLLSAARAAQRVDPMADVSIARSLADGLMSDGRQMGPREATRLLELLDATSDGARILPSLLRMLRHPNAHLRSKAVKMIGRGSQSAKWVRGRLAEADPRVRANAIESLWGVDTPEARELLLASIHDGDNRVVGNALVALHQIGECRVIPELFRMAVAESARFRASAAWAMGKSGDPRFGESLGRLMSDSSSIVRARALSSLGSIKAIISNSRVAPPWRVSGMAHDNPQRKLRRLHLAVAAEDTYEFPALMGTNFQVLEDGQPVVSYRFTPRPAPEAMSLSFVVPRVQADGLWTSGALSSLAWKRSSDLWGLQPYVTDEECEDANKPAEDPPALTTDVEALKEAFMRPPKRDACAGFWSGILQAVRVVGGGTRGRQHVIVFNTAESLYPPPESLIASFPTGTVTQVISTVPSPVLEDFCRRIHGVFQVAESADQVSRLISGAYLNLLARYEIAYAPISPECKSVRIRVQTASGWGEGTLPVSGSA
jgi:hypothetical protein